MKFAKWSDLQIFNGIIIQYLLQQRSANVLICHLENRSNEILNTLPKSSNTLNKLRIPIQFLPEHLKFTGFKQIGQFNYFVNTFDSLMLLNNETLAKIKIWVWEVHKSF